MSNSELIIYQAADGEIRLDVRLEDETVWLTQAHMAQLFGKSKKTVSEHIRNIFNEGELDENMVVRKFRTTTRHGAIKGKTHAFFWKCTDKLLLIRGRLQEKRKMRQEKAVLSMCRSDPQFYKQVINRTNRTSRSNGAVKGQKGP